MNELLETDLNKTELIELEKLGTLLLTKGWVTDDYYRLMVCSNNSLMNKRDAIFDIIHNEYISTHPSDRELLQKLQWIYAKKDDILLLQSNAANGNLPMHILCLPDNLQSCVLQYPGLQCQSQSDGFNLNETLLMVYRQIMDLIVSLKSDLEDEKINVSSILMKQWPENPMLNKVILQEIFKFLHLSDLRNCRTVCRSWNDSAKSLFSKRSTICFQILRPATFVDFYRNSCSEIPFTNYKFLNGDNYNQITPFPYIVSKMQQFFDLIGGKVQSLTLQDIAVRDRDEGWIIFFNISPWIVDTLHLTTLNVRCKHNTATKLCIPLDKLRSIKNIYLNYCHISYENTNFRLAPKKMSFKNVGFHNGQLLIPWCVNDIIDVSNVTEICIVGPCGPTFDMGRDVINAHKVTLQNTHIMNWERARGNIKLLNLYQSCAFPFFFNIKVQIKALDFQWSKRSYFGAANASIDLATFPKMIETLYLSTDLQIISSGGTPLPNLKVLHVDANHVKHYNVIARFHSCANLKKLELHDSDFSDRRIKLIDANTLPAKVKTLKLQSEIICVLECGGLKYLNTLVLIDYSLHGASKVMSTIAPKLLILKLHSECREPDEIILFVQRWSDVQTVVVGPLNFNLQCFENSRFSQYVDEKSFYYQFQNLIGKSLTLEKFNEKILLCGDHQCIF